MRPCYWYEKEICTKERGDIFTVEEKERGGVQVHFWTINERVY